MNQIKQTIKNELKISIENFKQIKEEAKFYAFMYFIALYLFLFTISILDKMNLIN